MDNVVKFPAPRRFSVEDTQDAAGNWTEWDILEITGNESIVYVVGEEDPWAGDSIEKIIDNCLDNQYGHDGDESHVIAQVNYDLYLKAIKIQGNMK